MSKQASPSSEVDTLRGSSALAIQAVQGITQIAEELHAAIASLTFPVAAKNAQPSQTRGITRFVYRSVRGITQAVGWGMDQGLKVAAQPAIAKLLHPATSKLASQLKLSRAAPYRERVRAALNGILGDTLAEANNPLAIPMQFRQQGQSLVSLPKKRKLLILVHGLCMNDLQWLRDGHDHGAFFASELGYEPVYLHYNTGRAMVDNGASLADLLEGTLKAWPVPIEEMVIVGHSMGGLVSRSACHHALQAKHAWVQHLSKLITLGTPHGGAPLEKAGRGVDRVLGISPYTAPFVKLGLVRSAGIQDLRHGAIAPSDEKPLWPRHVKLYALACTKQKAPTHPSDLTAPFKRLLGDGLVPIKSALALDDKPSLNLPLKIPASRLAVVDETDHFQMLGSLEVAQYLVRWLKA
jgi:pimeloyl-ACP methyl ester carboxylesterase